MTTLPKAIFILYKIVHPNLKKICKTDDGHCRHLKMILFIRCTSETKYTNCKMHVLFAFFIF